MRKLLVSLFLLGTISIFCNAEIDGYVVKHGSSLGLFTEEQPRNYAEIGIPAGESAEIHFTQPNTGGFGWERVSGYLDFNPGSNGRHSIIWTNNGQKGSSAVFRVTDMYGFVLTITVFVY